jgi:aldehyde dehydrogenase (NAD+)
MEISNQVNATFDEQYKYNSTLKGTDAAYRISKLKHFAAEMVSHQDDIENALLEDFGKAPVETNLTEILPIISMVNNYSRNLKKWMKIKKVYSGPLFFGTKNSISYEGKGNCLVISPWNYPFQLAIYPILTAFSAGNTVTLKPSEFTPATNKIIIKLLGLVFKPEEVSVIEGAVEASNLLLEKPFNHIFFTGSTPVGKIIMEKASKHLASVALELGGKSPVFIDKDFEVSEAARNIAWGKLVNGGQTCVAPDYLFIHKNKKNEFVKTYIESLKDMYGDKYEGNHDFCRVITKKHADRLKSMIDEAVSMGAKLEYGGELYENGKIQPTLLSSVTKDMKIMQEEIFGPVLPLIEYEEDDEALNYINENDNPLALYVYSKSKRVQEKFRSRTNSGGIIFNESLLHVGNPKLPFGGAGKSGIGRYHGHYGFEEMSNIRSVMHRKFDTGLSFFYPPYNGLKKNMIDKILKYFRFLL